MQEIFFRPDEISRSTKKLAAPIYNAYRLLLTRSVGDCVFIPLRTMQFQSVVSENEIIFIDSHGPYRTQKNSAGRCISYAWQFYSPMNRLSLNEAVDYDCISYCHGPDSTARRLLTEFNQGVNDCLSKLSLNSPDSHELKIISFQA